MDDRYGGPRAFTGNYSYGQASYPPQQIPQYASYPPLPAGPPPPLPPPSSHMYHFGGQANGHNTRNEQRFDFNSNHYLPSYPDRAPPSNRYRDNRDAYEKRRDRDDYHNRRDHDREKNRPSYHRRVRMAADRPLLHTRRESTPDQFDGMQTSDNDQPKFRDVENMSDSDSEVMEESDSDDEDTSPKTTAVIQEPVAAKWSNPEPYTSLPPPEASKKRKDVVKLIRKARISATKDPNMSKQVAEGDDFISFGLEDETHTVSENIDSKTKVDQKGSGINGGHVAQNSPEANVELASAMPNFLPVDNNIADKLANHKRKRETEDASDSDGIDMLPKRLKTIRTTPTGEILPEWLAVSPETSTPWVGQHQWTENAGFRLHKEICDFYEYVKPCDYEETMRSDLLNRIRKSVKKVHPDCEVHAFGSFAAGLYLPDADIDVVVVSRDFVTQGIPFIRSNNGFHRLADHFISDGLATPNSVEVITKAKVPLIKFKEVATRISIDVSFENLTGPRANLTFKEWKTAFPAMPILVTVIKQFLLMRGLNTVINGGIGGFSVTCLVTALLQNMPRVQSGELIPERNLGEVLLEFLDLYGNQFDLYGTAIDLNPPRFVDKAKITHKPLMNRESRLHIIDPNDRTNDISGGSRNITFIFKMFSYARIEILRAMREQASTSLLDWMLGGNYHTYTAQRVVLRRLHAAGRWTSVNINDEGTLLNDFHLQVRHFQLHPTKSIKEFTCKDSTLAEEEKGAISSERSTAPTASLSEDSAALLAFTFPGPLAVRNAFRKNFWDHIVAIVPIGPCPSTTSDNMKTPVFRIRFVSPGAATDALMSRKTGENKFVRCSADEYLKYILNMQAVEATERATKSMDTPLRTGMKEEVVDEVLNASGTDHGNISANHEAIYL